MALFCIAGLVGCSAEIPSKQSERQAFACESNCVHAATLLACARLGLRPADHRRLVSELRNGAALEPLRDYAAQAGGSVEKVSLDECLRRTEFDGEWPILIPDAAGHLHLLFGRYPRDGKLFCQLVHGDSPPMLLTESQMRERGFAEAWILKAAESADVQIPVGQGLVRADKLYHSFGVVDYQSAQATTFRLTNIGKSTILLSHPKVSCGCTKADISGAKVAPRESVEIKVTVTPDHSSVIHHTVALEMFEKGSGIVGKAVFTVLGNRPEISSVVPDRLDFGRCSSEAAPVVRAVRLTEVEADRFTVKTVDAGSLPVRSTIEVVALNDGLHRYVIHLSFDPKGLAAGAYSDSIRIVTDSEYRPEIKLPASFTVLSKIRPDPAAVSFGIVEVGQVVERTVRMIGSGKDDAVKLIHVPECCSVSPLRAGDATVLRIQARFPSSGLWNDTLTMEMSGNSGQEVLEIPCVAQVRSTN